VVNKPGFFTNPTVVANCKVPGEMASDTAAYQNPSTNRGTKQLKN